MEEEKDLLQAELRCLYTDLIHGEYGDWKIIKYQEYVTKGLPAPYDINELHEKRQAMRDRIDEIKEILGLEEPVV